MAIEWATACAHWPAPGHRAHLRERKDERKARQAVLDSDHHAAMHPGTFYAPEAPYRVMVREVSPWVEAAPAIDPDLQPAMFDLETGP